MNIHRTSASFGMLVSLLLGTGVSMGLPAAHAAQSSTTQSHEVVVHGARSPQFGWYSHNWTGYTLTSAKPTYTSIHADWVVPKVTASSTKNTYSSSWIGIDGYSDNNLIQVGTEQDSKAGKTSYYAWWEILPNPESIIDVTKHPVKPGDSISATVEETDKANHIWTITIADTTAKWSFTTHQQYNGPTKSAEWIEEAPYVNGKISQLSNYGSTLFTDATVNGISPNLSVKNAGAMVGNNRLVSTPSAPAMTKNSFAVAYGSYVPKKVVQALVAKTRQTKQLPKNNNA